MLQCDAWFDIIQNCHETIKSKPIVFENALNSFFKCKKRKIEHFYQVLDIKVLRENHSQANDKVLMEVFRFRLVLSFIVLFTVWGFALQLKC